MASQVPSTNIKGCKVCFNPYDYSERRPRSLPCGHTFCSNCISNNFKENKLSCPSCRREHDASASTDFPVNFELESFMQDDHSSGQENTGTMSNLSSDASRGISKKLKSFREEFSNDLENASIRSQEACSQLHQYKLQLLERRKQHQENLEEHRDIVHQSEDMIKRIDKETVRVDETIEEGKEKEQKIIKASNHLTAANTAHEVSGALSEADFYYLDLGKWTQEVGKQFPDSELITQSQELKERSKYGPLKSSCCSDKRDLIPEASMLVSNRYHNILSSSSSKDEASTDDPVDDECVPPSSTIQERIHKFIDDMPVQLVTLTVQTYIPLTPKVQDLVNMIPLVRAGVYAVQQGDDKEMRYARLTLEQNKLYLHVLSRTMNLPEDALILQHDDVMRLLDVSSRLTFLELGARGKSLGKLLIRLSPDLEYAQQFLLLCTGEMGPSYAKSKMLQVTNKGSNDAFLRLGDYENNDESGGKTLMEEVDWDEEFRKKIYKHSWEAGTLEAVLDSSEANNAQFYINPCDYSDGSLYRCFGRIEEGLSVVTKAISKYQDIKEVSIIDCGVVLLRS